MKISELCNFHHFTIGVHRIEPSYTIYRPLTVFRGQNQIVCLPFILIIQVMIKFFLSFAESPTFRLPLRSTDWRFAGFTFDYAFFHRKRTFAMGNKYPFYVLLILGLIDSNLMPTKSSKNSAWVGKKFESQWRSWIFWTICILWHAYNSGHLFGKWLFRKRYHCDQVSMNQSQSVDGTISGSLIMTIF